MAAPGINIAGTLAVGVIAASADPSLAASGVSVQVERPDSPITYLFECEPYDVPNHNLLLWTDRPDFGVWSKGSDISVSIGSIDPMGGAEAWTLSRTGSSSTSLTQSAASHKSGRLFYRLWLKSNGGDDGEAFTITPGGPFITSPEFRILSGPGSVSVFTLSAVVSGLSTTQWTEVEGTFPGEVSEDDVGVTIPITLQPGGLFSPSTDASAIVFRPQVEIIDQTESNPVRKTEEVNGPDGAPGQFVTERFSTTGYTSKPTDPVPYLHFPAAVREPYQSRNEIFSGGRLSGVVSPAFSRILLNNPNGRFDRFADYNWSDRKMKIWAGPPDGSFPADFQLMFDGLTSGAEWDLSQFAINLRDASHRLDKPAQERLFLGSGQCLRFDGASGVGVGNHPCGYILGDFTIRAMIRWYGEPTSGQNSQVVAWYGSGGEVQPTNIAWGLVYREDLDRLQLEWEYGAGTSVSAFLDNDTLDDYYDGQWHSYIFVRSIAEGAVRIYIDGELIKTVGFDPETELPDGGYDSTLNFGNSGIGTTLFTGDLDGGFIWRRALTSEEVSNVSDAASALVEPPPDVAYKFDEVTGSAAFEEVTNTRPGKLIERVGARLDGVNDYLRALNHADFNTGSEISLQVRFSWPFDDALPDDVDVGSSVRLMYRGAHFQIFVFDDVEMHGQIHDDTLVWIGGLQTPANLVPGRTYTATLTWSDDSEALRLYLDDVLLSEVEHAGVAINNASTNDMFSGATSVSTNHVRLWVHEIRMWDKELSASEVAANYNITPSSSESGLVRLWELNAGSGDDTDSTSAGQTLEVATGGATWVSTDGTYSGTPDQIGTGEGGPDLAGKSVPWIVGRVKHVPCIPVDPLNNVFLVAEGPLEELEALYEGGNLLTADTFTATNIWDHGSFTNDYAFDPATGLLATASYPTLPLTADVKGDSSDTGYVSSVPDSVIRVATRYGGFTWPDDFVEEEFEEFYDPGLDPNQYSTPPDVGYYSGLEAGNLLEIVSKVSLSDSGFARFSRDSRLGLLRLRPPEDLIPEFEASERTFERYGLRKTDSPPPVWRQQVVYGKHWRKLTESEVSASVTDKTERAALLEGFRITQPAKDQNIIDVGDPYASENLFTSHLYNEADANRLRDHFFRMFSPDRRFWEMVVKFGLLDYQVATPFTLTLNRFRMHNGKSFIVFGYDENATSRRTSLTIWG